LFSLLRQEKKWKTSFSPGKEAHRRNEQAHPLELNIQSTDIQNKKMFEICVLQFYYLHKITKDKLKVLVGLNHVVPFCQIIWKRLPCVMELLPIILFTSL